MFSIINDDTADIIIPRALRAMGVVDEELLSWPGTELEYDNDDDEDLTAVEREQIDAFNALVGTWFWTNHVVRD